MAKLSSLKIKMGQMQYEKQRKEHKLQAVKVGFSQDDGCACHMIMVFDLSLWLQFCFLFLKGEKKIIKSVLQRFFKFLFCPLGKMMSLFANNDISLLKCAVKCKKNRCQKCHFLLHGTTLSKHSHLSNHRSVGGFWSSVCLSLSLFIHIPPISFIIIIFIKNSLQF